MLWSTNDFPAVTTQLILRTVFSMLRSEEFEPKHIIFILIFIFIFY